MEQVSSSSTKRKLKLVPIPLNQFCDTILADQTAGITNCVEALRLVIRALQQSDRGRDGAVARIILSVAEGQRGVEDAKQELSKVLRHG